LGNWKIIVLKRRVKKWDLKGRLKRSGILGFKDYRVLVDM
jgi:hypothetical protein